MHTPPELIKATYRGDAKWNQQILEIFEIRDQIIGLIDSILAKPGKTEARLHGRIYTSEIGGCELISHYVEHLIKTLRIDQKTLSQYGAYYALIGSGIHQGEMMGATPVNTVDTPDGSILRALKYSRSELMSEFGKK